jgi:hypothetical protein
MNHLELVGYIFAILVVIYLIVRYSKKQKEE